MMASQSTASGWPQVKTKSYGFSQPVSPGIAMCNVRIGVATAGKRNPRKRTNPAAIEDAEEGRPTMECIQPKRNPHTGPKPRRRYAYSPPASGIIAPNSEYESAPKSERIAPTIQAAKTTETKRPSRAISAGLRKIPVPIMVPTTIAPEAQAPSSRTSSSRFSVGAPVGASVVATIFLFASSSPAELLGRYFRLSLNAANHRSNGKRDARSYHHVPCKRHSGKTRDAENRG